MSTGRQHRPHRASPPPIAALQPQLPSPCLPHCAVRCCAPLAAAPQVGEAPEEYRARHPVLVAEMGNLTHWPKHVLVGLGRGLLGRAGVAAWCRPGWWRGLRWPRKQAPAQVGRQP
jgi:hypothetical protein